MSDLKLDLHTRFVKTNLSSHLTSIYFCMNNILPSQTIEIVSLEYLGHDDLMSTKNITNNYTSSSSQDCGKISIAIKFILNSSGEEIGFSNLTWNILNHVERGDVSDKSDKLDKSDNNKKEIKVCINIDRIFIKPIYRGRGFGIKFIRRCLNLLSLIYDVESSDKIIIDEQNYNFDLSQSLITSDLSPLLFPSPSENTKLSHRH